MNPFNPNFGNVPEIFIDRSKQIQKVTSGLESFTSLYQTTLVYGLRGVGKTSFITDISEIMSQKKDWMVINLAVGEDLIGNFVQLIYKKSSSKLRRLLDQANINLSAFGIDLSYEQKGQTIQKPHVVIETILEKLKHENIKLLVTIDEAQSTPEMREFATIYQLMRRNNFFITLIMTGLPDKVSELQNEDVLTFLLRSGHITLEPLDLLRMKFSYRKAFTAGGRNIDDQVLTQMIKMTNGYAYGFQLLGYLVWETNAKNITTQTLADVTQEYQEMLYRNVYTKIYQSLSPMDRRFVQVMAEYSEIEVPVKFIGEKLNKPKNYLSNYRRRLLDDQVIMTKERGKLNFTLPFFKDFILEYGDLY